jgi:hypothetical protein
MLRFLFGMAAGFLGGYLYGSERAREDAQRRFSAAPEPLRHAAQTVASAAGGSAQRVAGAVAAAPVPAQVKQAANKATSTVQTTAEQVGQVVAPVPEIARPTANEIAGRPTEPLPRIEPVGP